MTRPLNASREHSARRAADILDSTNLASQLAQLPESAEIAYITKYAGKLDSGIAFTDLFYQRALAKSPLSTIVFANEPPTVFPADGLSYTTQLSEYRKHDPVLHLVNGMGSMHELLRSGFFPEHRSGLKIAFVHDEPSAYDFYNTRVWNRENVRDRMMSRFDGFIFVSSVCQEQWREYASLDDALQFYLPNTCAEEHFIQSDVLAEPRDLVRTRLGLLDDRIHLVLVATVQPRKAQMLAVHALHELRRSHPNAAFHLHLVGRVTQPGYAAELREVIAKNGLEAAVSILGEVPKAEALRYIYAADMLLLTSQSEAMPLVLLEAMQIGTPIVTTNVGGISELVADDETALFFRRDSAEDLAEKVVQLVVNPTLGKDLSCAARERYWTSFSNAKFFDSFDHILHELTRAKLPIRPMDRGGDGVFCAVVDGMPVSGTRVDAGVGEHEFEDSGAGGALQLTIEGYSDGFRELRSLLASLKREGRVWRVQWKFPVDSPVSARDAIRACLPFARMGLDVRRLRFPEGEVLLEQSDASGEVPALSVTDVITLSQEAEFVAAQSAHARDSLANHAASRELRKLKKTYRWRIANAVARPVLKSSWLKGFRGAYRKGRAFLRTRNDRRTAGAQRIAIGAIFNSPMQMMAFLSLWDARYRDAMPVGTPLVALVYSTNGANNFAERLRMLCERTGRFADVLDITPEYAAVYRKSVSFDSCVRFKSALIKRLGSYQLDTVFVAAFMSARAQKLLYETFAESTIRLFEDGVGSYVPKQIKLFDEGIVDRVSSGDCAEAHHIRLVSSVDLMLDSLPVPPQYQADIPRVDFPDVRTRSYTIDYEQFRTVLRAPRRSFAADDVLLLTQNFSDHLRSSGFTPELERRMNDAVIADLRTRGLHVVIRPHPRATADFWSPRWASDPGVSIWSDDPSYPVEVLLDFERTPRAIMGVSSSCLLYLRDLKGIAAYRYADEAIEALYSVATDEYKSMIDLVRGALQPYPCHLP